MVPLTSYAPALSLHDITVTRQRASIACTKSVNRSSGRSLYKNIQFANINGFLINRARVPIRNPSSLELGHTMRLQLEFRFRRGTLPDLLWRTSCADNKSQQPFAGVAFSKGQSYFVPLCEVTWLMQLFP